MNCRHCIYCSNLQGKEYHIFNEPVSKEEYETIRKSFSSHEFLMDKMKKFHEFKLKFPYKFLRGFQNEGCSGNHLVNCKNATQCFDSMNIWDGKYCTQMFIKSKDCMDVHEGGDCEMTYESNNFGYNSYGMRFCLHCMNQNSDLTYCDLCFSSSHLFGCFGLKRNKYCILNRQYTEEEYNELILKIIEHMKGTGEWGEFYPSKYSAFPYNLTPAQDWYPLTKEEAKAKGYKWRDQDEKEYQKSSYEIKDDIKDVDESIMDALLSCEACEKNYKIVEQEYRIYKRMGLPIPRKCFSCRDKDRMALRTGRKLFDRNCAKCGVDILTAYGEDRPEIIYCEKCYLDSLL